jgi:hypothetical protein
MMRTRVPVAAEAILPKSDAGPKSAPLLTCTDVRIHAVVEPKTNAGPIVVDVKYICAN